MAQGSRSEQHVHRDDVSYLARRFLCILQVVLLSTLMACSQEPTSPGRPTTDGGPGSGSDGSNPFPQADAGSVSVGQRAIQARECTKCHGSDMAGTTTRLPDQPTGVELYSPNLTPDNETGIGLWNDSQLSLAIRDGIDQEGLRLCPQMKHYADMPDRELASIVAYLRSLPPVKKVIPGSICPPLKTQR